MLTINKTLLSLLTLCSFSAAADVIESDILNPSANLEGIVDANAPAGQGAWSSTTFGNAGSKSLHYLYWSDLGDEYTLGNLSSLSFSTKNTQPAPATNFYISIYTMPDGNEDYGWYGQRLTFEPLYSMNVNAPANEWVLWSTDAGTNQLRTFDYMNDGGYTAPTLAQLLDSNYQDNPTHSFSGVDYSAEQIKGIAISTGSGWADSFQGAIDNVQFDFGNQGQLAFDLEPAAVPAPATLLIFALSIAGFGVSRFKRR